MFSFEFCGVCAPAKHVQRVTVATKAKVALRKKFIWFFSKLGSKPLGLDFDGVLRDADPKPDGILGIVASGVQPSESGRSDWAENVGKTGRNGIFLGFGA